MCCALAVGLVGRASSRRLSVTTAIACTHHRFVDIVCVLIDLARTFSLLSRIENGLEPLRAKFGTHVRKNGLAKLEQVAAEKDFVSA